MYVPAFNRYPPAIVQAFGRIERARGVIETAQILPAQEEVLRREARVGSIHYSNLIEGNELPAVEALRAVEHELEPTDRAKLELVNYVAALEFIDSACASGAVAYTPGFLKELHGVLTQGLGHPESRFKPHHEGDWRDGEVAVGDGITIYHRAPAPDAVPQLMSERLDWLEMRRTNPDFPTPILAGVAHFEVAEVHPFADYNGRVARLLAVAVFLREGYLDRRFFSPERYYAEDKDAYFGALRAIKTTRNLDAWLTYFVSGLAAEFERVAARVRELQGLIQTLPLPIQLTATEERAIAELTLNPRRELRIEDYVEITGASTRTASRELNRLARAGVIRARGATRNRRFALATQRGTGGRPRLWTDERVREELRALAVELGRWPSHADFRDADELPLYAAYRRTGGDSRWREEASRWELSFTP
jgi:Fic family protein